MAIYPPYNARPIGSAQPAPNGDEMALARLDATWIDSGDGFARVDHSRLVP